ncbi:MAG: hypothetical protein KAI83_17405 [Thiomargarita sp.]|nr:hypothetical protein [Thiomargarita sp.]
MEYNAFALLFGVQRFSFERFFPYNALAWLVGKVLSCPPFYNGIIIS